VIAELCLVGRGSPDVPSSAIELLTSGAHHACSPRVSERKSGALQDTHARGSMSMPCNVAGTHTI
jgi:hypothetical protein